MKAVVFDLGGVLIDWNPRYLYRKLIADEDEREWFLREVCSPAWNLTHDGGRCFADGIAEASAKYPAFAPLIRSYFDRWPEMLGGHIAPTVQLLQDVKRCGHRVSALTNWSAETFPFALQRYEFLGEFEDILVSGEEHMLKPNFEIYRRAEERFDLAPAETVFIDDSRKNVEAALACGWQAIQFSDAASARAALIEAGVYL